MQQSQSPGKRSKHRRMAPIVKGLSQLEISFLRGYNTRSSVPSFTSNYIAKMVTTLLIISLFLSCDLTAAEGIYVLMFVPVIL